MSLLGITMYFTSMLGISKSQDLGIQDQWLGSHNSPQTINAALSSSSIRRLVGIVLSLYIEAYSLYQEEKVVGMFTDGFREPTTLLQQG